MSLHRTIIRYYLIISKARKPGFPTFEEINDVLCDNDFAISTRTLQRDLENIRNDFGIEIAYDKYQKGYYIDKERSIEIDSILKFMEMAVLSGTLNELYKNAPEVKNYISFDSEGLIKGVEYISRILFALKHHRQVTISYQKFEADSPYKVKVKPGLLKEYQNRWYMLGILSATGEFRAFALDRMQAISVEESTFPESEVAIIPERFNHVIGLSFSDHKPEFVEITVDAQQWKYIDALPWHPSQELISKNEDTVTFRLFVVLNFELEQKILSEGGFIKGIKPEKLASAVARRR